MALSWTERLKYNLFLWYFSWKKVRLIHYCRPKIFDVTEEGVELFMPLDRRTRNHVKSMYIGAMVVGVDMVTGFTAMLRIRESRRNVILIFKDLKSDFYKRAEGDVHFICHEGKAITEAVNQTISTGERVNLPVKVIATVPDKFGDEPVAEFVITLSLKEK
ncbi:MAG: DUF4442 domain-containing protein [Candidatus Marinimicrobia bacterium]|nr:DUF4442 domain-containing protein [Candidatus Neomarinimicrobiota bacterium]MBL7010419.1 DUF4442 domain-containing protein [Candidatus Neomarinimicrobiota bacterium]MBL7030729.1 DUF4442 domain-containing protein [Candidatus Neomarinimicrobiota bacterium]